MDSKSVAKPGASAKRRFFACGLLSGVVIAAVAFWWMENRNEPTDSPTVLNIGDGRGLMGREILAAAAVLSNERVVKIEFTDKEFGTGSVETIPQNVVAKMSCDWMFLEVVPEKTILNGEVVSIRELRERLADFAESARLTETRPSLILHCDNPTSGEELVDVLYARSNQGGSSHPSGPSLDF